MATRDQEKEPWSKFYWADWRSDPMLRMCTLAARGLWIEMLAIMHEAVPYGHLLVSGKPPSDQQLATMVGCGLPELRKLKRELADAGVPDIESETWISRRMVRDANRRAVNRQNGSGGGNPALTGKPKSPPPDKPSDNRNNNNSDNRTDNHEVKSRDARDLEARSRTREDTAAALPEPPACTRTREADPATGLIDFFDDMLAETWGENRSRAWPAANDLQTARRWLAMGADDAAIKFMLRARMEAMECRDKAPPGSMAYFDGAIYDLMANLKSGKPVERYEPPAPKPPEIKLPSGPTWDGMGKHPRFGDWYGRVLRWREKPSTWFYNAWGVAPDQPWSDVDPETLAMIDADIAEFRAANHPTVMPLPRRVA